MPDSMHARRPWARRGRALCACCDGGGARDEASPGAAARPSARGVCGRAPAGASGRRGDHADAPGDAAVPGPPRGRDRSVERGRGLSHAVVVLPARGAWMRSGARFGAETRSRAATRRGAAKARTRGGDAHKAGGARTSTRTRLRVPRRAKNSRATRAPESRGRPFAWREKAGRAPYRSISRTCRRRRSARWSWSSWCYPPCERLFCRCQGPFPGAKNLWACLNRSCPGPVRRVRPRAAWRPSAVEHIVEGPPDGGGAALSSLLHLDGPGALCQL